MRMREGELRIMEAIYLVGVLLADGWQMWALASLLALTWVARVLETRSRRALEKLRRREAA